MVKILSVMLLIVFYAVVALPCVFRLCREVFLIKKECPKKQKSVKSVIFLVYVLGVIAILSMAGCNLYTVLAKTKETIVVRKQEREQTTSFKETLAQIKFEKEVINDDNVIWEDFLQDNLHFSIYNPKLEIVPLREEYKANIIKNRKILCTPLEELHSSIEQQQDRGFLLEPSRTLKEVTAEIPLPENRHNTSPEVFEEEFVLRALNCTSNSSFEQIYQAGRAADDTFKQYVNGGTATVKHEIFFAAMAISFYELSLSKEEDVSPMRRSYIEYRIAEIYIYLYDTPSFEEEYALHFLLSAESYLKRSKATLVDEIVCEQETDESQPYSDYYLALLQYDLLTMYDYNDQNMINECITYAISYKNQPNAKEKCLKSCDFFLTQLLPR